MTDHPSDVSMLRSTAFLYENSFNIKWEVLIRPFMPVSQFPRHVFDHKKIWKFGILTLEAVKSSFGGSGHLFVQKGEGNNECNIVIRPTKFPTIYEHKVKGIIVVPGTTYAETGFGLAKVIGFGNPQDCAVSVSFSSPVTLKRGQQCDLSVEISRATAHEAIYTIKKDNNVNAIGKLVKSNHFKTDERIDLPQIKERCTENVSGKSVYQMLDQSGFTYGDSFATISEAFRGEKESLALLKLSNLLQEEMKETVMHPAILDGMLQAASVTHFEQGEFFPTELLDVTWQQPLQNEMVVYSKLTEKNDTMTSFFLCLLALDGTILGKIRKCSIKFIGRTTFDVKNVIFRKTWSCFDFIPVQEKTNTVLFTSLKLTKTELPWIIVDLGTVETEDGARQLSNCLNNASQVCFICEQSISSVNGEDLLHELIRRLKHLRLVLLEHIKQKLDAPFYVVMETRHSEDCFGKDTANHCLNEATSAFCRCVRREYRNLDLKAVEIFSLNTLDFSSQIPTAIDLLSSSAAADLTDVKYKEKEAFMWQVVQDNRDTPDYRTTNHDNRAILCSALPNSVVDPSFILLDMSQETPSSQKSEIEFLVTSAVTHNHSLYWVTGQSQNFGSSEAKGYPVLSLEFKGKRKIKSQLEDALACYPSEIKGTISIPANCTMPLKHFPDYQPGFLLKLYTLWYMCKSTASKHVTILHSNDTKLLAKALQILLKSMNTKEVLLLTPQALESERCSDTLLLTIQLTSDLTQQLVEKSDQGVKVVGFANIMNQTSLGTLSTCKRILIKLLHTSDIFAPYFMSKHVPEIFKWIKSNSCDLAQLVTLMQDPRQGDEAAIPIKLSEILNTREISIEAGHSFDKMKTGQKHLVDCSHSYLVIGGLTGLGWESVEYLAKEGAGSVIIMGRSTLTLERQEAIIELSQSTNCIIQYEQGDVTNIDSLNRVLSRNICPKPLAGIIYSAAVLQDSTLASMTHDDLYFSLLPKICGAWNVHMLTKNRKLDIFLLHSSIASVFGNAGQSNYGAGNGFLDALASKRQECGLNGQSVNWGPLALGMLENNPVVSRKLQNQGYSLLEKADIPQCLTHLLMLNEPELILIRMNYRKVAENLAKSGEKALIKCLQKVVEPFLRSSREGESSKKTFNVEMIRQSDTETALQMLLQYVKYLVCDKALLDEETFDTDEELKGLGVDSMYAMEISGEILSECGVQLSLQEIQLQSARTLAAVILERFSVNSSVDTKSSEPEMLVGKQTVMSSIAESFFGFDTEMKFDPSFVLICTVQIPKYADTENVCDILKTCLSFHSLARSTCHLTRDSFSLTELSVEEAFDFQAISGQNLSEVEALKRKPIMLETHSPLRFIFLSDTKELVIVFHKLFFDQMSMALFVDDIQKVVDGTITKSEDEKDIVVEIQKTVSQEMDKLLSFWKSTILDIPHSTFLSPWEDGQSVDTHVSLSASLEDEVYNNILNITKCQNLSLFEYLISSYQLFLAFMSKKTESTLTTLIDLRTQIPALLRSLGRCTNLVPLICHFGQEAQTVMEFLKENKSNLNRFIKNGLLLFEEMKAILPEERVGDLKRNVFIFEDDTFTTENNKLRVEHSVRFAGSTETIFLMWHKRQTKCLEMELHLDGSRFTHKQGNELLGAFIDLLTAITNNPTVPLRNIYQISRTAYKGTK